MFQIWNKAVAMALDDHGDSPRRGMTTVYACPNHAPQGVAAGDPPEDQAGCMVCGVGGSDSGVRPYRLSRASARRWRSHHAHAFDRPHVPPAPDPSAAQRALRHAIAATATADAQLKAAVEQARRAGLTWDQIGTAIGMSRNGAQQRFGKHNRNNG